jgi:hypothetical protein
MRASPGAVARKNMPYARNMRSATNRHFQDAELLFKNDRYNTAGYHYGFSAECALKGAMERVGLPTSEVEVNDRAAYYVHFPELKRIPTTYASRLSQKIATMLPAAHFLQEWQIKMRYSDDSSVLRGRCEMWRNQVREFNNACMGL